jgi:hypothetical protein
MAAIAEEVADAQCKVDVVEFSPRASLGPLLLRAWKENQIRRRPQQQQQQELEEDIGKMRVAHFCGWLHLLNFRTAIFLRTVFGCAVLAADVDKARATLTFLLLFRSRPAQGSASKTRETIIINNPSNEVQRPTQQTSLFGPKSMSATHPPSSRWCSCWCK